MFGWKEKLEEGIANAISTIARDFAEAIINLMFGFLEMLNSFQINTTEYEMVQMAMLYSQSIALTLLTIKIASDAYFTHILRITGDPNADPGGILIRSIVSAAVIMGMPWIMVWMFSFSLAFIGDISNLSGGTPALPENILLQFLRAGEDIAMALLMIAILLTIGVVIILIVFIQMFIRAAEWALVAIAGPIMAVSLNTNMFGTWWKKMVTLTLGTGIQMLCLKLAFYALTLSLFGGNPIELVMFIGFLILTVKSPTVLQGFVDSTGAGRAITGAAQQMGSMTMMRRIMTKR